MIVLSESRGFTRVLSATDPAAPPDRPRRGPQLCAGPSVLAIRVDGHGIVLAGLGDAAHLRLGTARPVEAAGPGGAEQ